MTENSASPDLDADSFDFHAILDSLPEMIYVVDAGYVYRFINQAYASVFHIESSSYIGKSICDLHGEASFAKIKPHIESALSGERSVVEMATPSLTGVRDILRGVYIPYRDKKGDIRGVIAAVSLVLDRTLAELESQEKLKRSEERLRMASEAGNVGIWEWDIRTGELFWTDRVKLIYGLPLGETPSMDEYRKRIHPDDLESSRTNIEGALDPLNDKPYISVHRVLDGKSVKWVQGNGQAVFDKSGLPLRMSGTVVDITLQKETEARAVQLKEVGSRLARAMTTDEMGTIITSFGSEVLRSVTTVVYQGRRRALKLMRATGISGGMLETVVPGTHPFGDSGFTGQPVFLDDWDALGRIYPQFAAFVGDPVAVCAVPMVLDRHVIGVIGLSFESPKVFNEAFRRFILTFVDQCAQTLERVKLYDQEKTARLEAEGANKAKSMFLANMSHEIRTPLGAILGFADLVKEEGVSSAERDEFISIIIRNGKMLNKVINDILDLSKIESERLDVEKIEFNPIAIASDVISLLGFQAREKALELNLRLDGDIPEFVLTDPTRLKQILFNLIGNALKFTHKGKVELVISDISPVLSEERRLQFLIHDTGLGIAPEQAQRIFEPFVQADSSTTRQYGGTGLGLVIAKRLAQVLGGDLELLTSEPNRGSTFSFAIAAGLKSLSQGKVSLQQQESQNLGMSGPASSEKVAAALAAEGLARPRPSLKELQGVRILLVDDGPDNQALIGRMLRNAGAEVQSAMNGKEAIESALADDFDVILMDIQMPVMDGFGALSVLRANNYPVPVLALTAHAMKGDREQSLKAGFIEHLVKPVDRLLLIQAIKRFCLKMTSGR